MAAKTHIEVLSSRDLAAEIPACKNMTAIRSLSIAAPAYNEGEGIVPVVEHWLEYLRARTDLETFEIVICNDGSRDDTAEKLGAIAASGNELVVISHPVNQGAGAAVATAISGT